ncbi:hypothetical protein HNY73_019143 [Argiope bruennichi]|uniref:Uncharacterized protein n=1 Tax=Argiope bruennichi TaxID=94029 RepID=A0A8T0EK94_ARGBR|nr:hypothetical protein HNY73_019143 [Argiope bruennichi]
MGRKKFFFPGSRDRIFSSAVLVRYSLLILLVLVALVVCAMAQWPYNAGYYYNGYAASPYAHSYYGAYNPALNYWWKK